LIATDKWTLVCSVVFIDIVDYSTKTVEKQIQAKAQLNRFINEANKDVSLNDRIIIDNGDGATICILGDPEDALFVAMNLRYEIATAGQSADEPFIVRYGINIGPVKLVKDVNDRENLIGDGITTAQCIMNFAEAGQLLVSRSYYEVVSCLTQEYADLFHYIGMRVDEHIREHELYSIKQMVKHPFDSVQMETASLEKVELPIHNTTLKEELDPSSPIYFSEPKKGADDIIFPSVSPPDNLRLSKMMLVLCAALVVVVIAAAWFFIKRPSSDIKEAASSSQKTAPVLESKGEIPEKTTLVNSQLSKDVNPEPVISSIESPPVKKSILQLAVFPWGYVYLDGKKLGASPPLRSLPITPGKHKVEIKNTSFPVYSKTFEAKPGEKLKITHKFQ
jgi:hypothetical protein